MQKLIPIIMLLFFSEENESDYEDNITVTVPPPHLTSHNAYEKRNYHGLRLGPRIYPPGLDTPPKPIQTQTTTAHEDRSHTPIVDEKEAYNTIPSTEDRGRNASTSQSHHHQQPPPPTSSHGHSHSNPPPSRHPEAVPHGQSQNGYGAPNAPPPHYQQPPAQMSRPYAEGGGEYSNVSMYNQYPPRQYDQMGAPYRERAKGPYMGPRMPYGGHMHGGQMNMRGPRPMLGQTNLAQVYQGVQAKVGHG